MTNAILSIVTAAAIAIGSLGAAAPAAAANLAPAAPAVSQSAADIVEVRHGKRQSGFKRKGSFKQHHGKRGGFHVHFGTRSASYGAPAYCFKHEKVWTKFGWQVQRVSVC